MKNVMNISMGISLSMFMTFLFHCVLNGTRANGFFFQNSFVDPIHDYMLTIHCWLDYSFGKYIHQLQIIDTPTLC